MSARCKSCGAEIEWAESISSGKPIPLDPGEHAKGNLAVVNGKAKPFDSGDRALRRERRISHFATCPDAPSWRRP